MTKEKQKETPPTSHKERLVNLQASLAKARENLARAQEEEAATKKRTDERISSAALGNALYSDADRAHDWGEIAIAEKRVQYLQSEIRAIESALPRAERFAAKDDLDASTARLVEIQGKAVAAIREIQATCETAKRGLLALRDLAQEYQREVHDCYAPTFAKVAGKPQSDVQLPTLSRFPSHLLPDNLDHRNEQFFVRSLLPFNGEWHFGWDEDELTKTLDREKRGVAESRAIHEEAIRAGLEDETISGQSGACPPVSSD